jgi:hypothetical protein
MGAKLKSKTHLQNTFLILWAVFARLASKFSKSANMTQKIILKKIEKDIKKRRISRWFRICWKSCKQMLQKKL